MDGFLPIPPKSFPVEVPVLVDLDYEYLATDLESFPQSCAQLGLNRGQPLDVQFLRQVPITDCTKFLQEWLFFGLLSNFLGCSIKISNFCHTGKQYPLALAVDGNYSHNLFQTWQREAKRQPERKHLAALSCLTFAQEQSELFDSLTEQYDYALGAVSLSVKLLIELLISITNATFMPRHARPSRFHHFQRQTDHEEIPVSHKLGYVQLPLPTYAGTQRLPPAVWFLLGIFMHNGWCKSQALQMFQVYDYTTANYLALIPRNLPPSGNHDLCKGQMKCLAFNMQNEIESYQTVHVPSCSYQHPAAMVYMPPEKLAGIIDRGKVPIFCINLKDVEPMIYMDELTYLVPYFAISHVWSDGLGNAIQNGIRPCQLRRLRDLLQKAETLYNSKSAGNSWERWASRGGIVGPIKRIFNRQKSEHRVYFWLDTLCIPTGDERENPRVKELRMKAIKHITPIFDGAQAVLVLDSELAKLGPEHHDEYGRIHNEVLAARVLATKWMQRAWTLEEGSLARKCYFVVGNALQVLRPNVEVIDPLGKRIVDSLRSTRASWKTQTPLHYAVARFKNSIPSLVEDMLSEGRKRAYKMSSRKRKEQLKRIRLQTFVRGWNNLLNRTTSKPKDMQIIFANILDFNASSISRLHPNDGLVVILRSCEELPMSLLYNVGPRLEESTAIEDCWIPLSIDGFPLHDRGVLQRTEAGLMLDLADVDRDAVEIWVSEVKIPHEASIFQVLDSDTGHQYVVEKEEESSSNDEINTKKRQAYANAICTCIIMDKRGGSTSIDGYTGRGAFLAVSEIVDSGRTYRVQFHAQLRFWALSQYEQNIQSAQDKLICYSVLVIQPQIKLLLEIGKFNQKPSPCAPS